MSKGKLKGLAILEYSKNVEIGGKYKSIYPGTDRRGNLSLWTQMIYRSYVMPRRTWKTGAGEMA